MGTNVPEGHRLSAFCKIRPVFLRRTRYGALWIHEMREMKVRQSCHESQVLPRIRNESLSLIIDGYASVMTSCGHQGSCNVTMNWRRLVPITTAMI